MLYPLLIIAAVSVVAFGLWSYFHGGWKTFHQRLIGGAVFAYGLVLASLTGSVTSFVVPGFGAIVVGAGTGASVGALTYLVIGTVGVVTGGVGVAVGLGAMAAIGAFLGSAGAAAGGFGFHTVTYGLVSPFIWAPLLVLGAYFMKGRKRIKQEALLALSSPSGERGGTSGPTADDKGGDNSS